MHSLLHLRQEVRHSTFFSVQVRRDDEWVTMQTAKLEFAAFRLSTLFSQSQSREKA